MDAKVSCNIDLKPLKKFLDESIPEASIDIGKLTVINVKKHIEDNEQFDTGFMFESVYYSTLKESTYTQAADAAFEFTLSTKTGKRRFHYKQIAQEIRPENKNSVAIGVAANYAIFNEIRNPFMFPGIEESAQAIIDTLVEKLSTPKKKG